MTFTTALFAVILGTAIATALLWPWFRDEEGLSDFID